MDIRSVLHWVDMYCTDSYGEIALKHAVELIKRNSTNPPGDEYEASRYCAEVLKSLGFDVEWEEFEPKRCNVVATLGNSEDIGIILNGHLDVVPVTGDWKYPPL